MKKRVLRGILALFVMCFSFPAANAQSTPTPEPKTGLEGVITMSPVRPGPIRQGEPDSKPLPNTSFVVENKNGTVASFTTDDSGRFRILLPAGHYTILKQGGRRAIGKFGPFEVDVVLGKMTKVQWDCDTGIR
jgi:hypothetical protein